MFAFNLTVTLYKHSASIRVICKKRSVSIMMKSLMECANIENRRDNK